MKLYPHQSKALEETKDKNRVAYYHDMGLGKTFTGSEKLISLGARFNLVICQKSKINDWVDHFRVVSDTNGMLVDDVLDLTDKKQFELFCKLLDFDNFPPKYMAVGIINYELVYRRPVLAKLKDFTLLLDESSLIQNEKTKRSKFILKLKPANVILLSGTPTGGRYERLYSQLKLLGMKLNKTTYYNEYIEYHFEDYGGGARVLTIDGYKNVDRLKRKMRGYGCHFLKSEDVLDLPDQIFTKVGVGASKEYRKFRKDRVVTVDNTELVGDTTLTKLLYERQLCGQYSKDKLEAFKDLVESTEDRLIVFYNFTAELDQLRMIANDLNRPHGAVNGSNKNLDTYNKYRDSITFIQYQAGAMGLNLQLANKIIYFTPPLSSELYEQSKKRINRIGQSRTCYYYNLVVNGSVEEKIYKALEMRRDYTEALFEEGDND